MTEEDKERLRENLRFYEGLSGDTENENKPHKPITTRLGRVIYARKRHVFVVKDVRRVFCGAFSPASHSLGGLTATLITFNIYMIAWAISVFPRKEFLVWRWFGDYIQGILGGVRGILSGEGFTPDEISFTEGRDTSGTEGFLA